MPRFSILTRDADSTRALGKGIGLRLVGGEIVLLSGPLGAGKTTLAQGIAVGLDIPGRVQSPSFVLERIHRGRLVLRHLDFYRLSAADVDESGFFAELDESTVTVVEWAERAVDIPGTTLRARLDLVPGEPDCRTIVIETSSLEWGDKIRDAIRESGLAD